MESNSQRADLERRRAAQIAANLFPQLTIDEIVGGYDLAEELGGSARITVRLTRMVTKAQRTQIVAGWSLSAEQAIAGTDDLRAEYRRQYDERMRQRSFNALAGGIPIHPDEVDRLAKLRDDETFEVAGGGAKLVRDADGAIAGIDWPAVFPDIEAGK